MNVLNDNSEMNKMRILCHLMVYRFLFITVDFFHRNAAAQHFCFVCVDFFHHQAGQRLDIEYLFPVHGQIRYICKRCTHLLHSYSFHVTVIPRRYLYPAITKTNLLL
jgi:hypothetical protein